MPDYKKSSVPLLLALIGAVYIATLAPGHSWLYGDFSMYIAHARNIALGWPYRATGYIYNASNPYIGPQNYPPGFPLALAPVYKFFGLNLVAFKAENVLFLLAALFCVYRLARRGLGESGALAVMLFTALNPWFMGFRNFIYADWLSMFFMLAALLAADDGLVSRRQGIAAGLLAFAAYAVRPVGVCALAAIIAGELYAKRKPARPLLFACVAFAGSCIAQALWLHPDFSAYGLMISHDNVGHRAVWYMGLIVKLLKPFFEFFYFNESRYDFAFTASLPLGAMCLALCGVYYNARLRSRAINALDFFVPLYALSMVAAYDWQRNFFPIAPLYLYQAAMGWKILADRDKEPSSRLPAVFVCSTLLAVYAFSYIHYYRPMDPQLNVENTDSRLMFDAVKKNTRTQDIIICRKPRIMALYTLRRSAVYPISGPEKEYMDYFKSLGARYLVIGRIFEGDTTVMLPMIRDNPSDFRLVYENPGFRVFEIRY
jgi:4-amino-4-deoxy-L-arabinose transferase-like glycosyltransferase